MKLTAIHGAASFDTEWLPGLDAARASKRTSPRPSHATTRTRQTRAGAGGQPVLREGWPAS